VGPRAVLDAVVKRKIPSPRRELNPRTPIVQPVAQRSIPTLRENNESYKKIIRENFSLVLKSKRYSVILLQYKMSLEKINYHK
jgi:hypothetical protein